MTESLSFSAPASTHEFDAILFDLDGTIIDSTKAVVRHWTDIGREIGVDPALILATSHGRRTIDVLKLHDASKANWDYALEVDARIPSRYGADAVIIPGARNALEQLGSAPWAIVTSGSRPLATGWLDVMKLAHPKILVCAEDVLHGKPDPSCYNLAKERLNLPSDARILVVEDALAGIKSGKAAGCEVLGLTTTHSATEVSATEADWVVRDPRSLKILGWDKERKIVRIEISDALIR